MAVWIIILVVTVVLLTVLALLRTSKVSAIEKFQNASGLLSSRNTMSSLDSFLTSLSGSNRPVSNLQTATTTFTDVQNNYTDNILNKELLTNSVMPDYSDAMAPAVNQPDVLLNKPEDIIVRNLLPDNNSKFTNADVLFCKSAQMPNNLPPRTRGTSMGCGWYYVPNPNITSSGALGDATGPLFPKGPNNDGVNGIPGYGSGQWIWDISVAQQLEEIKNCARIKSCIAIDAPSVKGICGFCIPSGVAIPVNVDGTEKYTTPLTINNVTAPTASCDAIPILRSTSCPVPPGKEKPLVTPQGINCGTYGYPSQNYSIRLYKQDDCVNNMNGNWDPSGECSIQGGGSYSAVCAPLNGVKATASSPEPTICTPDINGKLSTVCLISVAKSLGYTQQGAILKLLQSADAPGALDKAAIELVKRENTPVKVELYKGGIISVAEAIQMYDKIYSLIKGGSNPIVQQAAMWLCVGTTSFDPCNLPDDSPGPFIDQCVQQQWRIAGCQPAGTRYPSSQNVLSELNTLTWGKVKARFQDIYNAMSVGTDSIQQDTAVLKCLGINTKRNIPPPCAGIMRDGLIINADSSAFKDPTTKAAYTNEGKWKSNSAVYSGSLVVTGTRVSDAKGAQFDGTTVMGTPNLIAQMLGVDQANVLNAPSYSNISLPPPPSVEPAYITGPWVNGNISPAPIEKKDVDDVGNTVYMIFNDNYTKMVNGRNVGKYYTGPISKYSSKAWSTYNTAPDGVYILGGEKRMFSATKPILVAQGKLGDIGFPHFGIALGSDQKSNFNILFKFYNPIQSSDGTMETLATRINEIVSEGKQNIQATLTVPSKGLSFVAPVTSIGKGSWFYWLNGTGAGPVVPAGDYYLKQNGGKNIPPFTAWDDLTWNEAKLTLGVATADIESRELWINPTVDTCEILSVFTGPSYSQSHTVMALYQGQLVIALDSVEKGYTFFNAGAVPAGQWSHIVHVYNKGVHSIYINGAGPVVMTGVTRANSDGYIGYSLGGGSRINPLYQRDPRTMPFQGEIGAFRIYNIALRKEDVQGNLAGTINTYINQVEVATQNDPNALEMAAGKFYIPSRAPAVNYQAESL